MNKADADPTGSLTLSNATRSALRSLSTEIDGLQALADAMQGALGSAFDRAVSCILAAKGRIVVSGMGKSGHVGRKIAATLASTGTPAHFVHPGEASHGDLGMIQRDDAIIALSWSGESSELADLLAYAERNAVPVIGFTSRADSALGRQSAICLELPRAPEACPNGLAPTTSTTMQLALGDALAVALLESRKFGPDDYRRFHPGGKLGAQLRQVRAVMHSGERLPLVARNAPMSEVLVTMSAKGFGCAIITEEDGTLAGIITDGDLRRHMRADLLDARAERVMTVGPKTIAPDMLVAEALEILENRKISSLVVVEDRKPVGLIHIHDAIRVDAG